MTTRTSTILGWAPVIAVALFIIAASAAPKFFLTDGSSLEPFMRDLGVWDLRIAYGVLELVCMILLLVPRTSTIGFILSVGLLGGALATNLTHKDVPTMPIIPLAFLFLLTLSAYFRNPELLSRFFKRPVPSAGLAAKIIGWIAAILIAAFNLFAAVMKFVPVVPGSPGDVFATEVGMKGLEYPLGVLEFIIVILFVIPRTSTVGFVLMVGYMGGVLAANLTHGFSLVETIPIQLTFLFLILSAYGRNRELLSRLLGRPVQ